MNIQQYQNVKDTAGFEITVSEAVEIIQGKHAFSDELKQKIILVRKYKKAVQALEKNIQDEPNEPKWKDWLKDREHELDGYKKALPAVTWSGTFTKRNAKNLLQYSQLICIDIDNLETDKLKSLAGVIKKDAHCYIIFISPSGTGIKVVFKVAGTAAQHKDYFLSIEQYFLRKYKIAIDPSGKDVNRLCFLSADPYCVFNEAAAVYTIEAKEISEDEKKKLEKLTKKEEKQLQESGQQCNDIFDSTQQVIAYQEGSRNNFIFKFACNCNRVGISQSECENFALSFATDMQAHQVTSTVKSAYNHNSHEHGKYKRQTAGTTGATKKSNTPGSKHAAAGGTTGNNAANSQGKGIAPDNIFWKEHKFKKGKGKDAYTETKYEIVRRQLLLFLFAQGFHQIRVGDKSKDLVFSKQGILKPVDPDDVKMHVLQWSIEKNLPHIEELLLKMQTKIFSSAELTSLKYKEISIKKDTAEFSYFYFQNCWVTVDNKGNITEHDYSTLDTMIWESNRIKAEYKNVAFDLFEADSDFLLPKDKIGCEFARFIALVSWNPNNEDEKHFTRQTITDRFLCFASAIGYMLSGYKHPSNRKGIFAVDHKICERGEAEGRTGKSLIPQACNFIKKVAIINGTQYDPKYQFKDEVITIDTKIISFNDMDHKFDVRNTFEKIADPYTVPRKNNSSISFTYEESPFVYYSTNYTPKGEGGSYRARMHTLEFSDYFSDAWSPYNEFEHGFFDQSWNADEWQRFYTFMLWCVAYYKENGLEPYPFPNLEARKLVNDVVPEFVDFMEDPVCVPKNQRLKKIDIMMHFNDTCFVPSYNRKLTAHTFTAWLKRFCSSKGYRLNPKQNGKHDKSNSVEYITIADDNWKDEQTKLL